MDVEYSTSARDRLLNLLSSGELSEEIEDAVKEAESIEAHLRSLHASVNDMVSRLESEASSLAAQRKALLSALSENERALENTPRTAQIYDSPNGLKNNESPRTVEINQGVIASLKESISAQNSEIEKIDSRMSYIDGLLHNAHVEGTTLFRSLNELQISLTPLSLHGVSDSILQIKNYKRMLKDDLSDFSVKIRKATAPIERYLYTDIPKESNNTGVAPVRIKRGD